MTAVLPVFGLLLATALVRPGDTLSTVADRELGDSEAASELAAVNSLGAQAPLKPGSLLVLPGPERQEALDRIHTAQKSMLRDANSEEGRKSAQVQLDRAFDALRAARYGEASALAQSAREELTAPFTRFSVTVQADQTRFVVESGTLEVTAAGSSSVASAGNTITARHGEAPLVQRHDAPPPPVLLEPADGSEVVQASMRWQPIPGMARYQVVVARDALFHECVFRADVARPVASTSLPDGLWFWRVLSVDAAGEESIATVPRSFTVRHRVPVVNVGQPIFKEGK
jgi:hypothetical protein